MKTVLDVVNLTKRYLGKTSFLAVDGISFSLKEGEILGLLGPNGSGKTTTIQMLMGTLTPSGGDIFYFGEDFQKHRSRLIQSVSFASTYTSLPAILTVKENLAVVGRLYGMGPKESLMAYMPLLERFGVADKLDKRIGSLSAGEETRLMLVKAFFIKPKIVLLDEPTASLDPEIAHEICQFLLEERKRSGISILFTSHKMAEVMVVCDRAIFLKKGKIVANERPSVLAKSIKTFVLKLEITDGLKRTEALAREKSLRFESKERSIEIFLGEEAIPVFLNAMIAKGVFYSSISIEKPSLEDYFLQLAGKK